MGYNPFIRTCCPAVIQEKGGFPDADAWRPCAPHPPVLLPEVGRGREREISPTDWAMRTAAGRRCLPDELIARESDQVG